MSRASMARKRAAFKKQKQRQLKKSGVTKARKNIRDKRI